MTYFMTERADISPALNLFHRPQAQASLLAMEVPHLLQVWQSLVPCRGHHDSLLGQEREQVLGAGSFGELKRGHSLERRELGFLAELFVNILIELVCAFLNEAVYTKP